ncbi:MAG TPA: thioredoxin [Anaerolineae bacterium]|nr:thioredoxin [Anaerolineae bacterium]
MSAPIDVTDATFEEEVLNSDQPVLIDFWATWCGPCRTIAPSVKQIAHDYDGQLKVVKMDVDHSPQTPGQYGVIGIPTLMVFKGGDVVARMTGARPKDAILAEVLPHLDATPA